MVGRVLLGRRFFVVFLATWVLLPVVGVPPASAVDWCIGEAANHLFVRSTAGRPATNGTTNRIFLRDRSLAPLSECFDPRSVSTAHFTNGNWDSGDFWDQIEVGWREVFGDPANETDKHWTVFIEYQYNGSTVFQRVFWLPNLLEVGTWDRFRVTNSNGQFFLKFDPLDGSGWRLLCPDGGIDTCSASAAAYWDNGIAMGETEQWGLGTSMRDQQNQLDYRDDSGTWTAWPDSNCIIDEATGWKWSQTSGDSYEVVAGGGAACSQ